MLMDVLKLLLFPTLMAFAAASDLLTMTISNRVSLALVAGFFVLAFAAGMNVVDVAAHVGAGCFILILAFGCFARGWIGGGDAKLAASTALWLGFDQIFNYLLCASLLGGLLTVPDHQIARCSVTRCSRRSRTGGAPAPGRRRRSIRHSARRSGAHCLPRHHLDEGLWMTTTCGVIKDCI